MGIVSFLLLAPVSEELFAGQVGEWVAMRGQVLAQVLPREVVSEAKPSVVIGLVKLVLQVILPAQMGMGVTVENLHITTLVGLAVEQADTAEEAVMALTVTLI